MRAVQRTLLHFAAYGALLLAVYPIIAMVYTFSDLGVLHMWLSELYIIAAGTAALVHAIMIRRIYRRRPVVVNIGFFIAGAIFAVIAFFICPFSGTFMRAVSALAVFLVYQAGVRLFFVEYDVLTHTYVYAGICTFFVLTSAAVWIHDKNASFIWQGVVFLIISGIFSLCRNFAGIDTALGSADDEGTHLPKGILKYNRSLLGVIGTVVLILVVFRGFIGNFLWGTVRTVIKLAGKVYLWFAGLFTGEEQDSSDLDDNVDESAGTLSYEQNELLTLVCTVILLVILLFLVIRFRDRIYRLIYGIIKGIITALGNIFGRSRERQQVFYEGGYTDCYEEIGRAEMKQLRAKSGGFRWKRELRRYRKMSFGAEKYRMGYSLLLYRLSQNGVAVSEWSTPQEVYAAVPDAHPSKSELFAVTECYERVRYGEEFPDSRAFEQLDRLLMS